MCIPSTQTCTQYTFPPSCMHTSTRTQARTGTHRSGDDMMTFCRPFSLSHTHTLSVWLGNEARQDLCPAQSTSAAVADNCRCCRSFDSSRAFCFRTCVNPTFLLSSSFGAQRNHKKMHFLMSTLSLVSLTRLHLKSQFRPKRQRDEVESHEHDTRKEEQGS